jgi:hypothetical protein
MRTLILAAMLIAAPALANDWQQRSQGCAMVAAAARSIMQERQSGIPKERLLNMVSSEYGRSIIEDAYTVQVFNGEHQADIRRILVEAFRDRVYVNCLNGY